MEFTPPLKPAKLMRRYKRFLADVETPEGQIMTLHCPNTGAMTGCGSPGDRIWYSTSASATRKYPHTWELTETAKGDVICVNTQLANRVVKEMLHNAPPPSLAGYTHCLSEVKYGAEGSRIDFMLQYLHAPDCYIEVKSVTLNEEGKGYFPDAVSVRGQKHLRELIHRVSSGQRAVLLFAVLHSAIQQVSPATHIDPRYSELLKKAHEQGVEVLAYKAELSVSGIILTTPIPVCLT